MARTFHYLFLFLFASLFLFSEAYITLNRNRSFVDEFGRVKIFHGMNVVYKTAPYYPFSDHFDAQNSLTDQDINDLVNWGFNAVRLGVMWPGAAPLPPPADYNRTYLAQMVSIVNRLGQKGVYSIIDVHQDLLSRFFCGEGAPDWAIEHNLTFPEPVHKPYPVDSDGHPYLQQCLQNGFFEYYFTYDVAKAFQRLFDDGPLRNHFVDYWTTLVQTFKGNQYVLGYELINEPFVGNFYEHPADLLVPGVADRVNLQPLYDLIFAKALQQDPHLVFFEKSVGDQVFNSGFEHGPGGNTYSQRQVLSYHIYCGFDSHVLACQQMDNILLGPVRKDLERLQVGGFMTEFGAIANDTNPVKSLEYLMEATDKAAVSWTYWQFKLFEDFTTASNKESLYGPDGTLEVNKLKVLSRTYVQSLAGEFLSSSYDFNSGRYQLKYVLGGVGVTNRTTEIYVNRQLVYPNGFSVVVLPSNSVSTKLIGNVLTVSPTSAPDGTIVQVTITRTE